MNLVFIVLDTLRADHMGCYGNTWIKTPRFDEFAQESAVFDRCYPESLPTVPARRAIFTGNRMYPFRDWQPVPGDNVTTPGWAPLRDTDVTVSEILLTAGYRTAFFTDVLHFFKPSMNFHRGFDEWRWIRGQEFDRYRSAPVPKDIDIDHYLTPNLYGTYAEDKTIRHLSCNAWRKKEEDWSGPLVFQESMRWLEENHEDSEKFYLNLLSNQTWVTAMANYGYTSEILTASQQETVALKELQESQHREIGDAQQATKAKWESFKQLKNYCNHLKQIAIIEFEDDPQLLEKLGILARS